MSGPRLTRDRRALGGRLERDDRRWFLRAAYFCGALSAFGTSVAAAFAQSFDPDLETSVIEDVPSVGALAVLILVGAWMGFHALRHTPIRSPSKFVTDLTWLLQPLAPLLAGIPINIAMMLTWKYLLFAGALFWISSRLDARKRTPERIQDAF